MLQLPDFVIVIVTRMKRWLSQIQNRRNQSHTKILAVIINDKLITPKVIAQKEIDEACDTKGNDVCTDARYEVMMKRIEKLENYVDSKFDEIIKRME